MATHSSILAWSIPWTEEPGGVTVHGVAESPIRLKQLSTQLSLGQGPKGHAAAVAGDCPQKGHSPPPTWAPAASKG